MNITIKTKTLCPSRAEVVRKALSEHDGIDYSMEFSENSFCGDSIITFKEV